MERETTSWELYRRYMGRMEKNIETIISGYIGIMLGYWKKEIEAT